MKTNVAIYLSGVNSLAGGGGVERFFSDFFRLYSNRREANFKLFFFMDQSTYEALLAVNKLDVTIRNIVLLKNISNRFKKQLENIDLYLKIKKYNIKLFHCANYGRHDFERLIFLRSLKNGPKLVQTIVDCQVPYRLIENNAGYIERYILQPNRIKFDGIFSWYQYYKNYVIDKKLFNHDPNIFCINSRFVLFEENTAQALKKENTFIFASRLDTQKKTDWFIHAVNHLVARNKVDWKLWSFDLYGNGPLEQKLSVLSQELGLENIINFKKSNTLHAVFPQTKVYISTQDFENFPSLSMMEAMYHKNIVLARNVGQTNLLVNDNFNGFMLAEDSPLGLCLKMEEIITMKKEKQEIMMSNSKKMMDEVHTPDSFIKQIELFWRGLV